MVDPLEEEALKWIEETLAHYQRVSELLEPLLENELRGERELRDIMYKYSPDALFVGRHYIQALRMRRAALVAGRFDWYCSAAYALALDWGRVRKEIPWMFWAPDGLPPVGDGLEQAVCILVAACGGLEKSKLLELIRVLDPKPDEVLQRCAQKEIVRFDADRIVSGPRTPVPRPD